MNKIWIQSVVVASCALLAPACSSSLAPYPEALFVVDTDMAVPRFVDRLRIDTFSSDGTWIDTHDYAVLNARDWPVSFGVFSQDETKTTTLFVRLRAYTDLRTRDYRGERFADELGNRPGPVPVAGLQLPRLLVNGVDVTPAQEPEPTTTIDRLVRVDLQPGKTGAINLVLRGDCVGTMAQLTSQGSYRPLMPSTARTCIDAPNQRVAVTPAPIGDRSVGKSVQGTWNPTTPCATSNRTGTVCVPGGAFFIGGTASVGWDVPAMPQRVVALSPFRMDANEVSVAQWRSAAAKGLKSPDDTPWSYDLTFPTTPDPKIVLCTYSTNALGREDYPLNCVTFAAARAYCKSLGGDLPTEAQWEYAAAAAGRATEAKYPWTSSDYPDCKQSVHGRSMGPLGGTSACLSSGYGPQPITTAIGPGQDITPLGIMNLGGSLSEWTLDTVAHYDDPCWASKGPKDPSCQMEGQPHAARGSFWGSEQAALTDRQSSSNQGYYGITSGFRCVYPGVQ